MNISEPPNHFNPFELLDIEKKAVIDLEALRANYIKASREVHPDRFQNEGGERLECAEKWTALLNQANQTLKETTSRLRWLMVEEQLIDESQENSQNNEVPQELLMEAFELQEQIEEAAQGSASDATKKKLEAARIDLQARHDKNNEAIEALASRWDKNSGSREEIVKEYGSTIGSQNYLGPLINKIDEVL